jgi:arylsulfatase A-like enzyme
LKMNQEQNAGSKSLNLAASWVPRAKKDNRAKALVHKLHHRPEYELYDLSKDPFELENKADDPSHKKTLARLKKALHAKLTKLGDPDPIATEKSLVGSEGGKKKKPSKKKG